MKALIIGLVNDKSDDPGDAMEPFTPNGSGERLWRAVNLVTKASRKEYVARFDFVNVTGNLTIHSMMKNRNVIVLGREAWKMLGLPFTEWFGNVNSVYLIPHPSGKSHAFNDENVRIRVGKLLSKLGGW